MKILILAQIPPPFHGQAIMQKYLVDAKWDWCEKIHIPLNYSKSISEVGSFSIKKIFLLFGVITKVWKERLKGKIDLIYYPPAGPHRIPIYRDIMTLFFIRKCSKKIIFHFHAGGLKEFLYKLTRIEQKLIKITYNISSANIVLLKSMVDDISWIQNKKTFIVPNGIENRTELFNIKLKNNDHVKILLASLISKEKGVFIFLQALIILLKKYKNVKYSFIGGFKNSELKKKVEIFISKNQLDNYIEFPGIKTGDEKWNYFEQSDIFCFPTHASQETFGIVLIEAMMMSLPIVATNWRGIPEIVKDGENGFLVPIKNSELLAQKLEILINDKDLREKMGKRGREIFLENFTLDKHLTNLENAFKQTLNITY